MVYLPSVTAEWSPLRFVLVPSTKIARSPLLATSRPCTVVGRDEHPCGHVFNRYCILFIVTTRRSVLRMDRGVLSLNAAILAGPKVACQPQLFVMHCILIRVSDEPRPCPPILPTFFLTYSTYCTIYINNSCTIILASGHPLCTSLPDIHPHFSFALLKLRGGK
jgi:hypothetical protein